MASLKEDTPVSKVQFSGDTPREEDNPLVTPSTPGLTIPKDDEGGDTPIMGNDNNDDNDLLDEDGDEPPPLQQRDGTYDSDDKDEDPFIFINKNKRACCKAMSAKQKWPPQSAPYDIDTDPFYMKDSEGRLPPVTAHSVMHHIVHVL